MHLSFSSIIASENKMKIDFIKKCVPYADGFELEEYLFYKEKHYHLKTPFGMGYNLRFLDAQPEEFFNSVISLLLQKAIEGVNRGDEYLIFQTFSEIHIEHNTDCNIDEYYSFEDYLTIDATKTTALEYVFEMET